MMNAVSYVPGDSSNNILYRRGSFHSYRPLMGCLMFLHSPFCQTVEIIIINTTTSVTSKDVIILDSLYVQRAGSFCELFVYTQLKKNII